MSGGRGKSEAAFRRHLAVYLMFALFFFGLNLLTSPGDWWFYWPLFFWGFALVIQAVATFGADAPVKVVEQLRSMIPGSGPPPPARPAPAGPRVEVASAQAASPPTAEEAEARVARLWRTARLFPVPAARDRAFRVVAAADRVAEVMAKDKTDPEVVRWFIDRYLAPTESLFDRYARLAGRGVAAAEPALSKVETHDLPLLEVKLNELYEQIHRGEVIDLEVTREMLELDLEGAPPRPPRRPPLPES